MSNTYTGKGKGFKSEIVVEAQADKNGLTDVKVISSDDSKDVGELALPKLVDEANKTGKFSVDAVSGASLTSKGFNVALKDIQNQVNGVTVSTETNVKDGTYEEHVTSFAENEGLPGAGKATVKVTFKDNKITDIEVPEYTDTPVIGGIVADLHKARLNVEFFKFI